MMGQATGSGSRRCKGRHQGKAGALRTSSKGVQRTRLTTPRGRRWGRLRLCTGGGPKDQGRLPASKARRWWPEQDDGRQRRNDTGDDRASEESGGRLKTEESEEMPQQRSTRKLEVDGRLWRR